MNNQNKYDLAIEHYEDYLELSPQLGLYRNPAKEAEVCRKLAHAYATQGAYTRSLSYLEKAKAIDADIPNNQLSLVEDERQLGLVHAYQGNYKKGLSYLEESIRMSEGMDKSVKDLKKKSLAETYLSLSLIQLTLGNYREAKEQSEKAIGIFRSVSDGQAGELECNLILGIIAREKSLLDQSMQLVGESKRIAIQLQLNTARQDQAIGEIYFLKGDYERGIQYKLLALQQAEITKIKPQIIAAYVRLGDAYIHLGDKEKANQYYQNGWRLQKEINDDPSMSASLRMRLGDVEGSLNYYRKSGSVIGVGLVSLKMGQVYFNRQNWDSAYSMSLSAKSYFQQAENNEGVAKANLSLAKILLAKGSAEESLDLLKQVRELSIQPELQWQAYYHEGIVFENQSQFAKALESYRNAISIIDDMRGNLTLDEFKSLFASTKVEVYDRIIRLLLNHYDDFGLSESDAINKSFEYNEHSRSRAFLDMLGNRKIEPKSVQDQTLLEEEQLLRLKIQQITDELNVNPKINRSGMLAELDQAQQVYDRLIQQMKLSNDAYATVSNIPPPTLKQIQLRLSQNEAILEYWVSEEQLMIWIVTKTRVQIKQVPIGRTDLSRQVRLARRSISSRLSEQSSQSLTKLYSWLIDPLVNSLIDKDHIIVIPHRTLHFLPYQALLTKSKRFLIEDFVISYAPSAGIWNFCESKTLERENKLLGMALGNEKIDGTNPLPGTKAELTHLSKIYSDFKSLEEGEFTETSVKELSGGFNYMHMATHGVFNKRKPMYSYLLMNATDKDDGRLTVDEILGLNIKSKFVTLSACETGLGELSEGDDLIGMSRAFIYAGSPQVVVSLWNVDDVTTTWLMTRFHQYVNSGTSTSASLAYAQRDLLNQNLVASGSRSVKTVEMDKKIETIIQGRDKVTSRDPYFWAPFVVIGSSN